MSIKRSDLTTELQEYIGSTANIKADSTKQQNTINRVLDWLQLKCNWMFTIRKVTFDYLADLDEYNISNYLGISDFKEPYKIDNREEVPFLDPRKPVRNMSNIGYYIKDNNYFLLANLGGGSRMVVDGLSSLTDNGTWGAVGDATGLVADSKEYSNGSGSLKFNIDVSASTDNYSGIQNTTRSSEDLTDYEDRSSWLADVYVPSITNFTSVTILWGSDTSNYWSVTVTAPVNSGSWKVGWNRAILNWDDATKTGSPDVTANTYVEARMNYASGYVDQSNARISYLLLNIRKQIDFEYFSSYMVTSSAGVYQSRFTASTDLFLGPDDLKPLILERAFLMLSRHIKSKDKNEISLSRDEVDLMLLDAIQDYGYSRKKGPRPIKTKL